VVMSKVLSTLNDVSTAYQYNFSANWICRGELDWLVITPKVLPVRFVDGDPNIVRLSRSNASARKSRRKRSDI